jgi:purine-nucleoside phosphorylase
VTQHERITQAAEFLRHFLPAPARLAVVLGSGLGGFTEGLTGPRIATADIPGWPPSTVPGHEGTLVLAPRGLTVLAGRIHLYEGYSAHDVVFPVRTLIALGARTIILTNASGGLDPTLKPGELVAISDHLNLTGTSPLSGPNEPRLGPRFPDLSAAYDPLLRQAAARAAAAAGLGGLREGIYAGLPGPAYETPAEVRMLRALGADLVGMSTVLETIAAAHMGARVLAISCVANLAAGLLPQKLSHEEVLAASQAAAPRLQALLRGVIDEALL